MNKEWIKEMIFNIDNPNNYKIRDEKFRYLKGQETNPSIRKKIYKNCKNLNIKINSLQYHSIADLISKEELLEGWCWQTTEAMASFMPKNSTICRGYLILDPGTTYYHSWLEFPFNNDIYVFDPCLNFLCPQHIYDKKFETEILIKIPVNKVREELIDLLLSEKKDDFYIIGTDNIDDPFYRTNCTYHAKIKNEKIKSLKVHYRLNV